MNAAEVAPADAPLDPDQRAAVCAPGGRLLILAGPGSGKTRVLIHRVARLLAEGADPAGIVLLTFTQRAARQMLERLARLPDPAVRHRARQVWAGTFHALCLRLLRAHADRIGLRRDFGLIDPRDAADVLDEALAEVYGDAPPAGLPPTRTILRILSLSLNADRPLSAAVRRLHPRGGPGLAPALDALYGAYCGRKLELNLLDYDDLLVFGDLLLAEDAPLADAIARSCRHVLVDEYQDTNPVQARIVGRLAAHHGDLCVVGDDAQAIYGFRGADVQHILGFAERPGARVARLGLNHRSTAPLVALSNASLARLRRRLPKALTSAVGPGPRPILARPADPAAEARFIADRALALRAEGVPLSDQAALYRAHAHARALQLELGRRGIPFAVRGGPRVFEQAHVRDVLAHLRALANPLDRTAWRRVFRLAPGVGPVAAGQIEAALFESGDPWGALAADAPDRALSGRARTGYRVARRTLLDLAGLVGQPGAMIARILSGGYAAHLERAFPEDHARRLDDLRALGAHAEGHDAASLLEELALADRVERHAGLTLSTIHQAKGLEWAAVYVMALGEGWFPARLDGDPDEERRLFYVAATRARRHLCLCAPVTDGGGGMPRRLSRFVAELIDREPELVQRWRFED